MALFAVSRSQAQAPPQAVPKELGYNAGSLAGVSASTTAVVAGFAQPAQGSAIGQRVGDRIQPMALYGHYTFAVADTTNVCRLTIFQWLPDSTYDAPSSTGVDILDNAASFPWLSNFTVDPKKRRKFIVLYDKIHALSQQGPAVEKADFNIKSKQFAPVEFTQAASTTGTGQLYYMYSSDSVAVSHPTLTLYSTYKWRDL